jgi:hypothetical protein
LTTKPQWRQHQQAKVGNAHPIIFKILGKKKIWAKYSWAKIDSEHNFSITLCFQVWA